MLNTFVSILLGINFLSFILGALFIFNKPQNPGWKLKLMSLSTILLMIGQIAGVYFSPNLSIPSAIGGVPIILLGSILFFWTANKTTQSTAQKLSPIYSEKQTTIILTQGPFRYIRHPFYTSYMLSFLGGAIAANTSWAILICIPIGLIYGFAARTEEAQLVQGPKGNEYLAYKKKTGKFFPRLL